MTPCRDLSGDIAGLRELKEQIAALVGAAGRLVDSAVPEWKPGPGGRRGRSILGAFSLHCRAWRIQRYIRIHPIERRYRELAEEAARAQRLIELASAAARQQRLSEWEKRLIEQSKPPEGRDQS